MKRLNLKVKGMTCTSCEVLIERKLRQLPGVEKVKVSRAKEIAEIKCQDEVKLEDLQNAVSDKGYLLTLDSNYEDNKNRTAKSKYLEIGAALLLIAGLYLILKQFDILPNNFGVSENMSYGFVFVLGLIAATSTCLAVSGGLLLAISTKFNEQHPEYTKKQKFMPHLYFNLGRIISYTLLGGLVGILGSIFTLSARINGIITILASLVMVILGLQLLQIIPWLNRLQLKMPKFIAHRIYDSAGSLKASKTKSFLFGGSTFFLPCGFTQALQLYVLSQGSFAVGALTMLAFSLGTLPSLISVGALTSFTKKNFQKYFKTFSAVLVIILGTLNILPGLTLAGADISWHNFWQQNQVNEINVNEPVLIPGEKQVINLEVAGLDYNPNYFTLKKGVPVEWNIDGRNARGCAGTISVPKLGISEYLPRDSIKTIEFTPQEEGRITFSCGMGMAGPGVFEVVP